MMFICNLVYIINSIVHNYNCLRHCFRPIAFTYDIIFESLFDLSNVHFPRFNDVKLLFVNANMNIMLNSIIYIINLLPNNLNF